MRQNHRRFLKTDAANALRQTSCPSWKITLLHAGISAAVALAIAVLQFILDQQIAGTGGLSGISNRAMLQTLQSMLRYANMLLLPFWEMGLLWAFLQTGRRQQTQYNDLLAGFHRFGPVLRGKLLYVLQVASWGFIGSYAGTIVYSFSPLSASFYEAAEPYLNVYLEGGMMDYTAMMADQTVMSAMVWAIPFILGGMAIATVPLIYKLRMMDYVLLDQPQMGAFFAMRSSKQLMRGKRMELFKLDLSFWWFYLLELLISLICYLDVLLPAFGLNLGISADAAFFAFYALALLCQIGLYAWKKPMLLTTYGRFYDDILPKEQPREAETAK